MIVVMRDGSDGWTATSRGQPVGRLRVVARPDRRTCLYLREVADEAYAPLIDTALDVYEEDLYVEVDEGAEHAQEVLAARGFVAQRHERHYVIPTGLSTAAGAPPTGFLFVSAAECDVDRLRELDDVLRQDVPGAAGWRNDPTRFADQTFGDPEFDPATYLIAVHRHTGEYVGLARVWIRPQGPRLGLIGVLPAYRRRGLAIALLTSVFGVLAARGDSGVTCEVDDTNLASNALVVSLGARRAGGAVELMRPRST